VENDYRMVKRWIDDAFDPSLNGVLRNKVAELLPDLKSPGTFKNVGEVVELLSRVCQGGFYPEGGQPPTLKTTYPALSENEKENINQHYLLKAKEFEASLRKSPGN